ncbi:YpmS family protein [Priestia endophytica]|uniref:YpmS family protein n=1 Tax=Priestia endophytica TaxID=135735 RepID=UPI00227DAC5C|nr:YpmS family protein [Priestia endophytica]MCY8235327.1 YpmS family protein [Priestia endophytica]
MMNMKNRWKVAFLTLLGVILFIIVIMGGMIFSPTQSVSLPNTSIDNEKFVQFSVSTHKKDLNKILNQYLNRFTEYNVILKNDIVEFNGSIPIFMKRIHVKMTFIPKTSNNGDLILIQKSLSLGKLHLPVSAVLKLVRSSLNLPEWIIIQPNKKMVYVGLQDMKMNHSNMKIRINHFNLKKDDISLTLLFPIGH